MMRWYRYKLIWAVVACVSFFRLFCHGLLEDVLLKDFMNSNPSSCSGMDDHSWNVSFDFTNDNGELFWSRVNQDKEEGVFLAQLMNPEKKWTIRVGHGGNIYSWRFTDFTGKRQEVIPPQTNARSAWVDEVIQSVAVDLDKNTRQHPYFLHQAGIYGTNPFYSPNIAKTCSSTECIFATWAQHAHLPTIFQSPLLVFTRYQLCQGSVVEVTTSMYNIPTSQSELNYFNVPWGGVRTSTFPKVHLSDTKSDMMKAEQPLQTFASNKYIPNLSDLGGYTTFSQSYQNSIRLLEMPCISTSGTKKWKYSCTNQDITSKRFETLQFVVQANNTCRYLAAASKNQGGKYIVELQVLDRKKQYPNLVGCRTRCVRGNGDVKFVNRRTGESILVPDIVWWSRNSQYTFFHSPNATYEEINQIFHQGDIIDIKVESTTSTTYDTAMAFSYVHGIQDSDDEANEWMWMPTRIRYGLANRDYTVFVSLFLKKLQTMFYFFCQFLFVLQNYDYVII